MTFSPRRALGALAALCVLQGDSLQAQTLLEFDGEQVSVPWSPAAGAFGRSVHGQLTPGSRPDVVVLCGVTPFVLVDADPYDAQVQLPLAALDVDVLSGGAPGGTDALAGVGATGLWLSWYDTQSDAFVSQSLAAGAWCGARMVRALDVDGDGLADLVGVGSDGRTLLRLRAQGAPLAFAPLASFEATATVRDLRPVRWDGDPARELALLTDVGVEVREPSVTLRDSWLAVLPGGAIAPLRQQGLATERIAWITAYAPPALQFLLTLAPGGAVHDVVDLGALDAFAAVGGDWDLDGDDDLVVSHHFSNELICFENRRSPVLPFVQSFQALVPTVTLFRVGPPDVGAALNQATPVRADLDGDGDLDLLYASQTSGTLEIMRGEKVDQGALKPEVLGGLWRPEAAPGHGELVLEVAQPAVVPASASHLRVRVWRRDGVGQAFDPDAVAQVLVDLDLPWPGEIALQLDATTPEFDATYGIELALVRLDSQGGALAEFPASLWEFMSNELTLVDLLDEVPGSTAHQIPTDTSIPSTSGGCSNLVKRPKLSGFQKDKVPSS